MCTNLAVRGGVCKRHGANKNKKRKAASKNTNDDDDDAAAAIEETEETQPSPSGKEDSKKGEHFEKFLSTIK
jgi:hypothetical protein